jgi:hypothetical protein
MDILTDWRYSEEKLELRVQTLKTLLIEFGSELAMDSSPKYSSKSIYECAHDWVSSGKKTTNGLIEYFSTYYAI